MTHEDLSYDCVIPSALLFNKNIEPNCIKFYAVVRNLTKMSGYCFATNAYLAETMECDQSSIKRYLASLIDEGFLETISVKNGIQLQRHVYISDNFKKSLRRLKIELPPAQNCAPPSSKLSYILRDNTTKEDINKKKILRPSLEASGLANFLLNHQKKNNPNFVEPNIETWSKEMDLILRRDGVSKERLEKIIVWACNHSFWRGVILCPKSLRKKINQLEAQMQIDEKNPVSLAKKNRQWAEKNKEYLEKHQDITVNADSISFNLAASAPLFFTFKDENFKAKVMERLKVMRIDLPETP